jgi:tetratricopeptide (TPR) repeat protein
LFLEGKYDEAIEKYKKVLEINPEDKDAYNN